MRNLDSRLKRLEDIAPYRPACATCGAAGYVAVVGLRDDEPEPAWIGGDGRCRTCGRLARVYRGIDLEAV